jgi:hypothetical protein
MSQIHNEAESIKKNWGSGPNFYILDTNPVYSGARTNHREATIAHTSVTPNGHHWTFTNGFKSGGYFFGKADYQS